jgi:hypothetical protein
MSEHDTPTFGGGTDESDLPNLPDIGELTGASNETILAAMREEAAKDVKIEDVSFVVPERPHFELIFHPYIDYDLLNTFMKKARKSIGGGKKEWHPVVFAHLVMSHTTRGVAYKGQTVQDADGDELTIISPMFHEMFKARSMQNALKNLYVHDGHIIATCQQIVDKAGYGDIDVESGEGGPLDS